MQLKHLAIGYKNRWARVVRFLDRMHTASVHVAAALVLAILLLALPAAVMAFLVNVESSVRFVPHLLRGEVADPQARLVLECLVPAGLLQTGAWAVLVRGDWTAQQTLWPALTLALFWRRIWMLWAGSTGPVEIERAALERVRMTALQLGAPFGSSFIAVGLLAGLASTLAAVAVSSLGSTHDTSLRAQHFMSAVAPAVTGMLGVVLCMAFATGADTVHHAWVRTGASAARPDPVTRADRLVAGIAQTNESIQALVYAVRVLVAPGPLQQAIGALTAAAQRLENATIRMEDGMNRLRALDATVAEALRQGFVTAAVPVREVVEGIRTDAQAATAALVGICSAMRDASVRVMTEGLPPILSANEQAASEMSKVASKFEDLQSDLGSLERLLIALVEIDANGRLAAAQHRIDVVARELQRRTPDGATLSGAQKGPRPSDRAAQGGSHV